MSHTLCHTGLDDEEMTRIAQSRRQVTRGRVQGRVEDEVTPMSTIDAVLGIVTGKKK